MHSGLLAVLEPSPSSSLSSAGFPNLLGAKAKKVGSPFLLDIFIFVLKNKKIINKQIIKKQKNHNIPKGRG